MMSIYDSIDIEIGDYVIKSKGAEYFVVIRNNVDSRIMFIKNEHSL